MAKNWQQLVKTAPTRSYQRLARHKSKLLARCVPRQVFDGGTPPTYLYASGRLNRCNPEGVACIYFGEGPDTARAEFDSYYPEPLSELGFYARVRLHAILDLCDSATRKHFDLKHRDFTRSYITKSGDLIPLQAIGKAVSRQTQISAIRFPSNAMQKKKEIGYNLVVFQNLIAGADFLEIMEDDTNVERWPK